MRLSNEVKVGLIVFTAAVVLIATYWFLGGFSLRATTYPIYGEFPSALRLNKGAEVRMAGVRVGVISSIGLTPRSRARVDMLIDKENRIPKDSIAFITSGALAGDNYVDVRPGSSRKYLQPGDRIKAGQYTQFDQLMQEGGKLLQELQITAKGINEVLGNKEVLATIKATVGALKESAEAASSLIASAQGTIDRASPQLEESLANVAAATSDAARAINEVEEMIARERPNISAVLSSIREASSGLNSAITQTGEIIGAVKQSTGQIGATLGKVDAAAAQAQEMLTNLNAASQSVRCLATDPEMQQNLKTTLKNAAEASQKANQLLNDLERRFGPLRGPNSAQKAAIPDYGLTGNALWKVDSGNYRFDANYTFAGRQNDFYRAGFFDIGSNTKLNLQGGKTFDPNTAFRYGLYASRLGVGLDRRIGQSARISADLFNPDDPMLELRGIVNITGPFHLYTGVEDLFNSDGRDVLIGVHYQK